ncbi:uncharacterized protein [Nicotiana sylvestris]
MKLTKAMKKLKFWSRKKKKKRAPLLEQPPSPPPPLLSCYYQCPYNYPIQPSAPPLPPWFEYEQQQLHDSIFTTEQGSTSTSANLNQTHGTNSQHSNNVSEINQPKATPSDNISTSTLPQQYMVPNQVYGVPVTTEARTERAGGAFGCVINLFRCFFPCFHIRELK